MPPNKLRLQSPKKIRDRLQTDKVAIVAAHSTLQDELRRLEEEVTMTPSTAASVRGVQSSDKEPACSHEGIHARLAKLESSLADSFTVLTSRYEKLQADTLASLTAYESRSKKLDELYREANEENEALYAQFNDELAKILKAVRAGNGVEQVKQRAKQQEDEVSRLKRENARLKREIAGSLSK